MLRQRRPRPSPRERSPERVSRKRRARRRRPDRGPRAIFRGPRLGVRALRRRRDRRVGERKLGPVRASRRLAPRRPGPAIPRLPRHQGRAREAAGDLREPEPHQRAAVARPFRDVVGIRADRVPPFDRARHPRRRGPQPRAGGGDFRSRARGVRAFLSRFPIRAVGRKEPGRGDRRRPHRHPRRSLILRDGSSICRFQRLLSPSSGRTDKAVSRSS